MPLCERAAGAGFQVPLESYGALLVQEFHDDGDLPGPAVSCVCALARVVRGESRCEVRRHAGVVPRRVDFALKDVHRSLSVHVTQKTQSCCLLLAFNSANDREEMPTEASGLTTVVVASDVLGGPPSRLRRYGGQPSGGLPTVAHALVGKRERRLVDQTGVEPVTS